MVLFWSKGKFKVHKLFRLIPRSWVVAWQRIVWSWFWYNTMGKAVMEMSKYDTTSSKIIFMSTIIDILRQFLFFISSCIKRNKYERPNYHQQIYFLVKSEGYFYKLETWNYLYIINIHKHKITCQATTRLTGICPKSFCIQNFHFDQNKIILWF